MIFTHRVNYPLKNCIVAYSTPCFQQLSNANSHYRSKRQLYFLLCAYSYEIGEYEHTSSIGETAHCSVARLCIGCVDGMEKLLSILLWCKDSHAYKC